MKHPTGRSRVRKWLLSPTIPPLNMLRPSAAVVTFALSSGMARASCFHYRGHLSTQVRPARRTLRGSTLTRSIQKANALMNIVPSQMCLEVLQNEDILINRALWSLDAVSFRRKELHVTQSTAQANSLVRAQGTYTFNHNFKFT